MLPRKAFSMGCNPPTPSMMDPSLSIYHFLGRVVGSLEVGDHLLPGRHWNARHVSNQGEHPGAQAPSVESWG